MKKLLIMLSSFGAISAAGAPIQACGNQSVDPSSVLAIVQDLDLGDIPSSADVFAIQDAIIDQNPSLGQYINSGMAKVDIDKDSEQATIKIAGFSGEVVVKFNLVSPELSQIITETSLTDIKVDSGGLIVLDSIRTQILSKNPDPRLLETSSQDWIYTIDESNNTALIEILNFAGSVTITFTINSSS